MVVARQRLGTVAIVERGIVFATTKRKAKPKRLLGNASAPSPSLSVARLVLNLECETY